MAVVGLALVGLSGSSKFVPASATTAPLSVAVDGNHLVDGSGNEITLRGVDYSGTEYACEQGWGPFQGPSDAAGVAAMKAWGINVVRIPLNEDCWLGINGVESAYSGSNYINAIVNYVDLLNSYGIYAILDLALAAPGTTLATQEEPMPDEDHSPAFWSSVATTFAGNPAAIFDLFNEPFPDGNTNDTTAWNCWLNGGMCDDAAGTSTLYQEAGMQQLVNSVRATGATNVIMIGGTGYSNVFNYWSQYTPVDPLNQIAADFHNYDFDSSCATVSCWNTLLTQIGNIPLITGEMGFGVDYVDSYMDWADTQPGVSYLAWTWDTWGCNPDGTDCNGQDLISNYGDTLTPPDATPTDPYGTAYQQHLALMAAPNLTSTSTAGFTKGAPESLTVTTTGYPTPALSVSGTLPAGLTFTDNGDGTATLSGTPSATGTYPLTVSAVNGVEPATTQQLTVSVTSPAPTGITPNQLAQGITSFKVVVSGSGFNPAVPATVTASGKHITFKSVKVISATTIDATATISATAATGTRNITVTQGSTSGKCSSCLQIASPPTISGATPSTVAQGVTHTVTVSGTGFFAGASVSFSGPSTKITATVLGVTATTLSVKTVVWKTAPTGEYTLDLTNGNGAKATLPSALAVSAAPTITNVSPSTLAPGQKTSFTITGTSFSPDATVTLPSGVTISGVQVSSDGTTITGTIKVTATHQAGSNLQVKVTDGPAGGYGTVADDVLTIT